MSTLKIKRENGKIFCPLADSWHIETPEEKVRQEYIKILVEDYGYSLDQMAQEIKVNNSQRGQGKARADIVIWKSKQDKIESKAAFIVVECKAENVRIREEDYYQGYNYASWAGASFFVTTNEKETKYFNVDKDYLPKELVEVVAIPTAEEALNDKKVKDILSKTKTFTRDDFTKILRTCHNIATGAVVDAVWEAKIGNMGKAIYVFEVQSKGSIDSLILNLKKAQSNAAVQAVVAVADEEQLAKIIQESAGVIDEKSLRTWDCEDVLAVYDALVRAHESINKLALVPESF